MFGLADLFFAFSLSKDLYGAAAPAVEGDSLDVTLPKTPPVSNEKGGHDEKVLANQPGAADEGLSVLQKLLFGSLILGACAAFLKTRPVRKDSR